MGNAFCHIELNTGDVAAAKAFYKKIFDWKLSDMPMGTMTYTMLDVGKGVGGGMMQKMAPEHPTQWVSYVEVASVRATIAKARDAGATVLVEYQPIPGTGAIGLFMDPSGAWLGLWEPAAKPAVAPTKAKAAPAKKPAAKKPAPAAKSKSKAKPAAKKAAPAAKSKAATKKKPAAKKKPAKRR